MKKIIVFWICVCLGLPGLFILSHSRAEDTVILPSNQTVINPGEIPPKNNVLNKILPAQACGHSGYFAVSIERPWFDKGEPREVSVCVQCLSALLKERNKK